MGYFDDLTCFEPDDELQPITAKDLKSFEQRYSINFPEDYKNLLLRRNGGYFRLKNYEKPFFYFRSIDRSGTQTATKISSFWNLEFIDEDSAGLAQEDQMPPHLLIIGEAGSGTRYLCLGISGETFGKVYTWITSEFSDSWFIHDLDMPYIEKGEVRDRSEKVADSVRELLDGLCNEDEARAWAPNEFG
ncbi:MAG: SMI1/KNR4 family protein [Candidatus Sericytochromatia bacterium]|nr:SMI1/KNR4 family protein [Candidatus Sericytochromatia bacterium]